MNSATNWTPKVWTILQLTSYCKKLLKKEHLLNMQNNRSGFLITLVDSLVVLRYCNHSFASPDGTLSRILYDIRRLPEYYTTMRNLLKTGYTNQCKLTTQMPKNMTVLPRVKTGDPVN